MARRGEGEGRRRGGEGEGGQINFFGRRPLYFGDAISPIYNFPLKTASARGNQKGNFHAQPYYKACRTTRWEELVASHEAIPGPTFELVWDEDKALVTDVTIPKGYEADGKAPVPPEEAPRDDAATVPPGVPQTQASQQLNKCRRQCFYDWRNCWTQTFVAPQGLQPAMLLPVTRQLQPLRRASLQRRAQRPCLHQSRGRPLLRLKRKSNASRDVLKGALVLKQLSWG